MEQLTTFISDHFEDDTSKLLLNRKKWPGIDMDLAVSCIESRRKLKGKVQEWHDTPGLIFPFKLSAEQCSSSATAEYKASLAEKIVYLSHSQSGNIRNYLKTFTVIPADKKMLLYLVCRGQGCC